MPRLAGRNGFDSVVQVEVLVAVPERGLPPQRQVDHQHVKAGPPGRGPADAIRQRVEQHPVRDRGRGDRAVQPGGELDADVLGRELEPDLEHAGESGPGGQVGQPLVGVQRTAHLLHHADHVRALAGGSDGREPDDVPDRAGDGRGVRAMLEQAAQWMDAALGRIQRVEAELGFGEHGEVGQPGSGGHGHLPCRRVNPVLSPSSKPASMPWSAAIPYSAHRPSAP